MTDNKLLNQLKLVHRTSKSRHSVCTFYKTLPPTPAPEIECFHPTRAETTVVEARAMAILDEAKCKPGGASDVRIGKLWRTEILLGREADGWRGDVELSDAIWDDTLMKLGKDGDKWEIVVVLTHARASFSSDSRTPHAATADYRVPQASCCSEKPHINEEQEDKDEEPKPYAPAYASTLRHP
ncbi:hypothetical protein KC367_g124 [Hortaea werneckii]|nr:hypothetical protein KC367_g124 [Hortaea werneckii]